MPLGVARIGNPWLAWPVAAYTFVIRGTPMLVQLFVIYYGLAQFDAMRESVLWVGLNRPGFARCWPWRSTPPRTRPKSWPVRSAPPPAGEIEAAKSVGMSSAQTFVRIVLPSAPQARAARLLERSPS